MHENSLFMYLKVTTLNKFKSTDVANPGKLVTGACYDKQ